MRIATQEYGIYRYEELSNVAKENVKRWLLDDDCLLGNFKENCEESLSYRFPNSKLSVSFSLSSCQGDGVNIEGTVKLYDVLPHLEGFTEKEVRTLEHYFEKMDTNYVFENNLRYGYSCKFIDKKNISYTVDDSVEDLKCWQYKNINRELITKFFESMIAYFEALDETFEKDGYAFFYEMDDEQAQADCDNNDYEFFEDGSVFQKNIRQRPLKN